MSKKINLTVRKITIVLLAVQFSPLLFAYPREMILQGIKGPWELAVGLGAQDSGIVFPIEVADEDALQTLDKTFPVMGSPLLIKLQQYCPDLKWNTVVAEDPKGGPVVSLTVSGKGTQQELVLLADVPEKRSVTASIGGLAIRQIHDPALLKELEKKKMIGIVALRPDPNMPPQEFAVQKGDSFQVSGTPYTAKILDYMPHYSIDPKTKEVKNYSDNPVNPALKVRLSDGKNTEEQWAWSNFAASPHALSNFPIQVEFSDFDSGPAENRYFIVSAGDSEVWLCYKDKNTLRVEKARMNHPYPFKDDEEYTFTLDSVLSHGALSNEWANTSDQLEHPALVVSVESDKGAQEVVVELNKPAHVKTAYGTLVLLYRQKTEEKQHGTQ